MDKIPGERETVNPHRERSLLNAQAAAQWRGFPVGWLRASPHVEEARRGLKRDTTILAMLDSGCAHAEFAYGRKSLTCDLTPGALGLFTAGTEMNRVHWECQSVRRIIVELDLARLSEPSLLESVERLPQETEVEFRDDALSAVLRSMVTEVANGSPNGQLYAESLSLGVALRLRQRASTRGHVRPERGKLNAVQLQRVQEWIGAHLESDISLTELARLIGFSSAHFVRLFKNTLGCAPYHHVRKMRLDRARHLLLASDLPIATIAVDTGFASQSHLTTAFVREYKTPPGQLRRSQAVQKQLD